MAIEREVLDRQKARLVRPVLEQMSICQKLIEQTWIIIAEPAPEHQIGRARHDTYRIDLQRSHPPDHRKKILRRRLLYRTPVEALDSQLQCAGSEEGEGEGV